MTNGQPDELTARLESVEQKLDDLGDELDIIRTIQTGKGSNGNGGNRL
ncbi:MAG: hypothetical protein MET45_04850 [Nostoc sp. LLA-1]|nr:hypothetical protein [Cyanocohniella sp. LLY]